MSSSRELMSEPDIESRAKGLIHTAQIDPTIDPALYERAIELSSITGAFLEQVHREVLPAVVAQVYVILRQGGEVTEQDTRSLIRIVASAWQRGMLEARASQEGEGQGGLIGDTPETE